MSVKRSPIWAVSSEEFKTMLDKSGSMSELLACFGLLNKGGNFYTLKGRVEAEGLKLPNGNRDRDWTGKTTNIGIARSLTEIMVEDSSYRSTTALKKRLVKKGYLESRCCKCGLTDEWQGEAITLHLDHINGNPRDHRLENLRILCPNCHSQTPTHGAKRR